MSTLRLFTGVMIISIPQWHGHRHTIGTTTGDGILAGTGIHGMTHIGLGDGVHHGDGDPAGLGDGIMTHIGVGDGIMAGDVHTTHVTPELSAIVPEITGLALALLTQVLAPASLTEVVTKITQAG